MIGFKQSVKVFSVKFSLPMDPRKFTAIQYTSECGHCGASLSKLQETFVDRVCVC